MTSNSRDTYFPFKRDRITLDYVVWRLKALFQVTGRNPFQHRMRYKPNVLEEVKNVIWGFRLTAHGKCKMARFLPKTETIDVFVVQKIVRIT